MSIDPTTLANAELDLATLGEFVNNAPDAANPGHEAGTVTNRTGSTFDSLQKKIEAIDSSVSDTALAAAIATCSASAASAVIAAATLGVYPNTAATNVPKGLAGAAIANAGSGMTNGLDKVVTWASGNMIGNPVVWFDVVGGVMTNVRIKSSGLYIGGAITLPTPTIPGAAGGAALTLTSDFLVAAGQGYWVQSADGLMLNRYKNVAGAATADASISSIPTTAYIAAVQAGLNAAVAASLLDANKMGAQRTVPAVDLSNGYGAPTVASNGQVTFSGGGAIKGFLYHIVGPGLVRRDAGLPFTVRVPIVSGAPASARLIQFNAANTEVGARPTALISATEIGFHGVVLNAATVKLQLEITSGGSALVTTFMAVSYGEPATVVTDSLYNEAEGYFHEQLNEIPLVVPTYTFSENGTGGTFVGGVLTQGANAGAASGLQTNSASFVVGGKYHVRFRANSRLVQVSPSFAYTGDANAFNQITLAAKIIEIPGDTSHVLYELAFIIPPHPTQPTYPLRGLTIGFYSPVEAVVCDDFIFATDFQFPLVRTPPLAVRTYISQAIATALAAGGTTLQAPTAAIDLWGDSLIDFNHSAGSVSDALATLLGGSIPVQNFGVATQNALEIGMRAGGTPVLLSLVGDAIPATTTAVAISNFNAYASPITSASNSTNGTDPLAGTLGGVPGHLDAVRSGGNVIGLTFTRTTAGSAVPINRNTPFLPTQGEATRSKHQVLVWGENDVGGTGGTVTGNFIADLYDRQVRAMLPVDKRFLVGTVLHSNRGTSSEVINDINATVAMRFSRYMVDLTSAPTAEEMATLGFTPNADDITDMDAVVVASVTGTTLTINSVTSGTVLAYKYFDPQAFRGNYVINSGSGTTWTLNAAPGNFSNQSILLKGWIPRGLRNGGYSGGTGVVGGDQLHLNAQGNQLWALRLYRAFKQRGWF